jgi:hypothetical protein
MNQVTRLAFAGLCLVLGSGPALAEWKTSAEPGADGRGDIILLRGEAEQGRWFQFMCRGEERSIAVITPDGSNHQPTGSETLDLGADTGSSWVGPADYYRHSNGWLGLSYRNIADFEGIVRDIIGSNTHITADILDPGGDAGKAIVIFAEATGSTKAGREFAERCYSTAPGYLPAGVTPAWSFSNQPGTGASLVADLGKGASLRAVCGADRRADLTLQFPDDDLYFPRTDGLTFALRIQVDQIEFAGTGAGFRNGAQGRGIRYNDPAMVQGVIRSIAAARGYVAVLGTAEQFTSRWAALNVGGLKDAAAGFVDTCWGGGQPAQGAAVPAAATENPAAAPATLTAQTGAWTTTIEPIGDGQGNAAIMVGEADEGRWIQLWCRGDQRRLSILVNDGLNDDPSGVTATVEFAADTGSTWRSEADFYRHDPNWLGLSYRNIGDLERIVQDIIGAQGNISVSIMPTDTNPGVFMTASAQGSTKAGRAFAAFCFGAGQVAQPAVAAPAQPSPGAAGAAAWTYATSPDPEGGTGGALMGDLGQGGYFFGYCDGRGEPSLAIVSYDSATFPYRQGDAGLSITLQVDGQDTTATGEFFAPDANSQAIMFNDSRVLERLFGQVAAAQSDVAFLIHRPSDGMTTRWPAANLRGLSENAAQLVAHCGAQPTPVVSTPSQPAQPAAPASPVSAGVWVTTDLSGNTSGPYSATMTASAENADATLRIGCDPARGLLTLGISDRRGLAGDGAYDVTVSIDGQVVSLQRTAPERAADGTAWVVSTDAGVLGLVDQLSVAKQVVQVELLHAMGARRSYRFNGADSVGPATDMYFRCIAR